MDTFRRVLALHDDPDQQCTGSDLELAALGCVRRLRSHDDLAQAAADPQRHAARDEALAHAAFLRIPPQVLTGRTDHGAYFPMACFNAAGSSADGVLTPYQAATFICGVGYYEPTEERALLTAMREYRIRYEDEPEHRPELDGEITRRLRAWLRDFTS
ncbi:hypothetical protein [Saccharopolyspora cebuensis]|uniref:Uncharacterized protein n=1 Tax=Saccharopolyspora cebuensis TaxID=418759 RepID=A0ABV4CPM9_9PSEU